MKDPFLLKFRGRRERCLICGKFGGEIDDVACV